MSAGQSEDGQFEHVTTDAAVHAYKSSGQVFDGLLKEIRGLSHKKPDATMSASKVKMVNRVLTDLLVILKDEPMGKYLELLDDATLPQMSDAVLAMVQFETALEAFRSRYRQVIGGVGGTAYWITAEQLKKWEASDDEDNGDDEDEEWDDEDDEEDDGEEDGEEDDEEDDDEEEDEGEEDEESQER